mmetsp:Transcript_12329/g.19433  ORF Transcript_12329/g.19433 Transcript_12329/m.19433 type:complete len:101 (-) Transcript_12329:633-935(-)
MGSHFEIRNQISHPKDSRPIPPHGGIPSHGFCQMTSSISSVLSIECGLENSSPRFLVAVLSSTSKASDLWWLRLLVVLGASVACVCCADNPADVAAGVSG